MGDYRLGRKSRGFWSEVGVSSKLSRLFLPPYDCINPVKEFVTNRFENGHFVSAPAGKRFFNFAER